MLDLTVTEFLDRVQYMPDVEAEGEIIQRRETVKAEYAMLLTLHHDEIARTGKTRTRAKAEMGLALQVISTDLSLLNDALAKLRQKMDRLSWKNAVQAIYGDEGLLQCKLWIIQNDPNPNRDHDIDKLLAAHGFDRAGKN